MYEGANELSYVYCLPALYDNLIQIYFTIYNICFIYMHYQCAKIHGSFVILSRAAKNAKQAKIAQ